MGTKTMASSASPKVPPAIEVEPGHRARCIRLDVVAAERAALTPALSQGERGGWGCV